MKSSDRPGSGPQRFAAGTPGANGPEENGTNGGTGGPPSAPPTISLPKGGGAIRGMGEKFSANPVTGTGSMQVPIAVSPGRSGFGPQLSLSYDSGAANGPFGFGWGLSLPSITRKTDKGLPRYEDADKSDVFILSGAEDLVPVLVKNSNDEWRRPDPPVERAVDGVDYSVERYRPRIEGHFARIERWTSKKNPADVFWRSISRDNITTWYGKTPDSRVFDPSDPGRIFAWLICESYDGKGNVIVYGYKKEDSEDIDFSQAHERNRTDQTRKSNRYLKRIRYGNRKPYLPELLQTEPWPSPSSAGAPDGSADWLFEVVFDYGEHDQDLPVPQESTRKWSARSDPFSSYRAGFEVRTYRLCQRVLMFHHFPGEPEVGANCLVRSTDFTYSYEEDPADPRNPIFSFLLSATQSGHRAKADGSYLPKSLPPLEFEYSQPTIQEGAGEVDPESVENLPYGLDSANYQWVDLDGEGLSGILTRQAGGWFYKRNLGRITIQRDGAEETTALFAPMETVARQPSLAGAGQQFLDLAGDGQVDLTQFEGPLSGYYERTQDGEWSPFVPFESAPSIIWDDPNLRFVDLTGDGHADILITEDEVLTWYPSLAEAGFAPAKRVRQAMDEEKGPRLIFADGQGSIHLADLSGDGLTDLVRVRNGEVCYWPNLGYGRFGTKVTMDDAPHLDAPDQFEGRRVQMADIDGSGVTDIIYLGVDGVRLYFNHSGNSWSKARTLPAFPRSDDLSSVAVADLFGNGTACLVWSSPMPGDARRPMRYLDLMDGQKPHLLITARNNLGAETHVHYAASTKFYLRDREAGRPWITRLPFPVHVVEKVETHDRISRNRFVTRYAYHHGHFDGEEREFRGFGMVEQWDTEEFAALTDDRDTMPAASNVDGASHVPPVRTKTWFHTGVYVDQEHVSRQFEGEYYREPGLDEKGARELLIDDTVLPAGLTIGEEREACRALKGSMLRQEVYANDAPPGSSLATNKRAAMPYTVVQQNLTVRRLQPRAGNRHAIFFSHPREAITYHYERKLVPILNGQLVDEAAAGAHPNTRWLPDPRIQHALTLEVDDFGNALKEAAIGYGRRFDAPDAGLVPEDRERQRLIHITCTENTFTNSIIDKPDVYRTPLPAETRTYELCKPEQEKSSSGQTNLYRFEDLLGKVNQAGDGEHEVAYEDLQFARAEQEAVNDASEGKKYFRRLIEHVRTLYRDDDDPTALLPPSELKPLALPGESYKLAFTPGLLGQVYVRGGQDLLPADPADLLKGGGEDRGGYIDLESDGRWWIPSGRVSFSEDPNDTAAEELAHAREHFFLPRRYRDPFGQTTTVAYDDHDLLMLQTSDALGNRVTVGERLPDGNIDPDKPGNDYRVLQSRLVMDPNRNRTAVAFDALGMVVGTAVMGKPPPAPTEGDSLDGFEADLTEAVVLDHLTDPLADPHAILGSATTRLVYDMFAYRRTRQDPESLPPVVYTLARETHDADLDGQQTKVQHGFSYSDGFGREIQKKMQAEPEKISGVPGPPRWVGSGWAIFNNKGKPVRQYEPFFDDTHGFRFGNKIGVSPILFYDPVERAVATLHPNHTYEKVVFDPWRQQTWDVNDTVSPHDPGDPPFDPKDDPDVGQYFGRLPQDEYLPTWHDVRTDAAKASQMWPDADEDGSPLPDNAKRRAAERDAAGKASAHAGTPTTAHLDTLGRPFLTVAHNRFERNNVTVNPKYEARVELDIEGNQRTVRDARKASPTDPGRIVMRYDYDMLGNRIHQASMEAGERWTLNDVSGNPTRACDSRGFVRRLTYDELRRPLGLFVTENGVERLAERTVYGESLGDADNHRTRVHRVCDGAGVATSEAYDFKGNLRRSKRELLPDYGQAVDWQQYPVPDDGKYTSSTCYDALDRPLAVTTPDNSVYRPTFNEANLLDRVEVNLRGKEVGGQPKWTPFVTNIDYDARGQRESIAHHNGATTTYDYDPFTFRLTKLRTTRPADPDATASQLFESATLVQDLRYTYDPAGNITRIEDAALKTIFHNNERVEPICEYTYDAIYRLIKGRGREHVGQTAFNFHPQDNNRRDLPFLGLRAHPNDAQAMRNYTEHYEYDEVGNFELLDHAASGGSWNRAYAYEEDSLLEPANRKSNRLTRTTVNGHTETYGYADASGNDVQGCMTAINAMQMSWDFEDQLQQVDLGGGGKAYYVYDAAGQRARKVIDTQNGTRKQERLYFGGFEVYREYDNDGDTVKLERESLHVMDDRQRIALVELKTIENGGSINTPASSQRYQLGNHLGSVNVELDEHGALISYEEHHPYGTTAVQAGRSAAELSLKRYRYTGKERDEETGFTYHGARYYAPWLGKWTSCDPSVIAAGLNTYVYGAMNPLRFVDTTGRIEKDTIGGCYVAIFESLLFIDRPPSYFWDRSEAYKKSYELCNWGDRISDSDIAKRTREDVASNEIASRIVGGTLGIISVVHPNAPNDGSSLASPWMREEYEAFRFASTNATAIVGAVQMLGSMPPPTPPRTPAQALASGSTTTTSAAPVVTASLEAPLIVAMAGKSNKLADSGSNKRTEDKAKKPDVGEEVGNLHPKTGKPILAEVEEVRNKLDVNVEASKPSQQGKLTKRFLENTGTHDPSPRTGPNDPREPYNPSKAVMPSVSEQAELFGKSIELEGKRYAMDLKGNIHQFQPSADNVFHWAGAENSRTLSGALRKLVVPSGVRPHLRR